MKAKKDGVVHLQTEMSKITNKPPEDGGKHRTRSSQHPHRRPLVCRTLGQDLRLLYAAWRVVCGYSSPKSTALLQPMPKQVTKWVTSQGKWTTAQVSPRCHRGKHCQWGSRGYRTQRKSPCSHLGPCVPPNNAPNKTNSPGPGSSIFRAKTSLEAKQWDSSPQKDAKGLAGHWKAAGSVSVSAEWVFWRKLELCSLQLFTRP